MRIILALCLLSAPALASRSELEPRLASPVIVLTCEAAADKSKEVKLGKCKPAETLPQSKPSLSERKAK